jgi:transcriptional regulator with XRE-family HTH domain
MSRDAFGPNLRRHRNKRGVTLKEIADATKISVGLLEGLERNDFRAWPAGIYARAFVRQYAIAIGVGPDTTVDEFCRWHPQGDRRADRVVREHAEIVNHDLVWSDDLAPDRGRSERRGAPPLKVVPPVRQSALGTVFMRLRRAFGRA